MKNIFTVLPIIAMFGASSGFAVRYESDDESDDGREVGFIVSSGLTIRYESDDESDDGREVGFIVSSGLTIRYESDDESDDGEADSDIDSGGGDTSAPNSPDELAKRESLADQESTSSSFFSDLSKSCWRGFAQKSSVMTDSCILFASIIGKDESGDLPSPSQAPPPLDPASHFLYRSPLLRAIAKKRDAKRRARQESQNFRVRDDVASIMQRYADSKVLGSDSKDYSDSDSDSAYR